MRPGLADLATVAFVHRDPMTLLRVVLHAEPDDDEPPEPVADVNVPGPHGAIAFNSSSSSDTCAALGALPQDASLPFARLIVS